MAEAYSNNYTHGVKMMINFVSMILTILIFIFTAFCAFESIG